MTVTRKAELGQSTGVAEKRVAVCCGTACLAGGSARLYHSFVDEVQRVNEQKTTAPESLTAVTVIKTGCQGLCRQGPLVSVLPDNTLYTGVTLEDIQDLVTQDLVGSEVVERLLYHDPETNEACCRKEDIPFYNRQCSVVLHGCGTVNPESLDDYLNNGGYQAAKKAFLQMTPEEVCREILASGLRGRGGAGFPTGEKWQLARIQAGHEKYVICNGDEGDPGAFMNRNLMEGDPHSVLEGLMIAARAIGAQTAWIYLREEYPLAVRRMKRAVTEAEQCGFLGDNAFGSGVRLHCEIFEGAGAYVCGEETALIATMEGQRGIPRSRPPYPSEKGLWGKPTVVNNVETLVHVVRILRQGAEAFKDHGTATASGTKTFALTGHVVNAGMIEIPFGTTLREIIYSIGGGVTGADGKVDPLGFKAVQIGGPSGSCLGTAQLDLAIDFESLHAEGAVVGSGGLVVMNQNTCMVSMARYFMEFSHRQSCGKCVLCREGTKQMLSLLDRILTGQADERTIPLLVQLARAVQKGSYCNLGRKAPNPVLSTLALFGEEYQAHVESGNCPAGRCASPVYPEAELLGEGLLRGPQP